MVVFGYKGTSYRLIAKFKYIFYKLKKFYA